MADRIKKLLNNLRYKYRLVIYNETTFETEGSYLMSKLNILLALSTVLVVGMIISILLITYTPLKYYIPGFGDAAVRKQLRTILHETEDISDKLEQNELFVDNLKKVLKGEIPSEKIFKDETKLKDSTLQNP